MQHNNTLSIHPHLNTNVSLIFMLIFVILGCSVSAQSSIICNTLTCIQNAMDNASPGDEIIIASGNYTPSDKYNIVRHITIATRFYAENDGTASNPIIIRGADPNNPPTLQGPNGIYDGYVFYVTGNHWIIKDLKMKNGSKGLILDNANNVQIEKVEVFNIAQEGIHVRDGSSNTIIKDCFLHDLGIEQPENGEGLYVGSDRKEHNGNFNPYYDNTTVVNCTFGPNIKAESIDVKEEVDGVVIRNCDFFSAGIVGDDRNDAFIDLKGINCFIYDNTFNINSSGINAAIDVIQREAKSGNPPLVKTGYRNAIFNNTFNLGSSGGSIPIVRFKGGDPYDIHRWDNQRVPNTPEPDFDGPKGTQIFTSCPSWNIVSCNTLSAPDFTTIELSMYPNPATHTLFIKDPKNTLEEFQIRDLTGKLVRTGHSSTITCVHCPRACIYHT